MLLAAFAGGLVPRSAGFSCSCRDLSPPRWRRRVWPADPLRRAAAIRRAIGVPRAAGGPGRQPPDGRWSLSAAGACV